MNVWWLWFNLPKPVIQYKIGYLNENVPQEGEFPLLNNLMGWRNHEVYHYITYESPDWTRRLYE